MEFFEKLNSLSAKIRQQAAAIKTEEATKNAFVMKNPKASRQSISAKAAPT